MECINVIYITSTAYSGSTILGFILGSSPYLFNAGEVQYFNQLQTKDEICSCGKLSQTCPFWSSMYKKKYNVFKEISFSGKLRFMIDILLRKNIEQNVLRDSDDYTLFHDILKKGKKYKNEIYYIIDNSKSIWRLLYLMKCAGINVKVIFLQRDIFGSMGSFVKHKKGFWRGLVRYIIINYLIKRFLLVNSLDHIKIDYNNLCSNSGNEFYKLEEFLNINISKYSKKLDLNNVHVPTGNMGTRKSLEKYNGLHQDLSWKKILDSYQKIVLQFCASIFQRE